MRAPPRVEPGWYLTSSGGPIRVLGPEWDRSGLFSRTVVLVITGHNPPHLHFEKWASGYLAHRLRRMTPLPAPPEDRARHGGGRTDVRHLSARAEELARSWTPERHDDG